jgi:hypothetical protein
MQEFFAAIHPGTSGRIQIKSSMDILSSTLPGEEFIMDGFP